MLMREMVPECDFTDRKYNPPVEGGWFLAQGATGRYCCVMYVGPEWLAEHPDHEVISRDEAEARVNAEDGAWVDF
jgi:hypothetical protein